MVYYEQNKDMVVCRPQTIREEADANTPDPCRDLQVPVQPAHPGQRSAAGEEQGALQQALQEGLEGLHQRRQMIVRTVKFQNPQVPKPISARTHKCQKSRGAAQKRHGVFYLPPSG